MVPVGLLSSFAILTSSSWLFSPSESSKILLNGFPTTVAFASSASQESSGSDSVSNDLFFSRHR